RGGMRDQCVDPAILSAVPGAAMNPSVLIAARVRGARAAAARRGIRPAPHLRSAPMPSVHVHVLRAALFPALLPLAFAACGGPPPGPVNGAAALEHVRQLSVVIGERPFGSDGLAKAADYISGEIRKLGLDPQRHEAVDEPSSKTMRNVYTRIEGK